MVAAENASGLLLIVFVGVSACDEGTTQAGGATAEGGTSDDAGAAGTADVSDRLCSTPTAVGPPSPVDDCVVVPRAIDPESTCGAAECPIIRAFDLSCEDRVYYPQLASLDDRTFLLVTGGASTLENRLLTVTDTETEVSQINAFRGLSYRLSRAAGTMWYVGEDGPEIVAVSANGETWSKSTVVSEPSDGSVDLSDAAMVDETRGYVAYRMETMDIPHLVTWDGSCWTDEILTEARTDHLVFSVDGDGLPWTAWVAGGTEGDAQIVLRDPTGVTQPVHAATQDWHAAFARFVTMLPGGVDGHDAYPALAFLDDDGIHVARRDSGSEATWSVAVLPDSSPGSTVSDCPNAPSYDPNPCGDLTSCATQVEGNSEYFGLARTASQGTFAVWVSYSSLGSSMLEVVVYGDELPQFYCVPAETTGSGTAELVLARVGATVPVPTRYQFDLGAGLLSHRQRVAVAARGDTLIVAAVVSGGNNPALTYFEIDSTILP